MVVSSVATDGKVATLTVTEMKKEGKITVNGVKTTDTPDYKAAAIAPKLDGEVTATLGGKDVTFKLDKAVAFDATSSNNEITVNEKAATVAVDEDNLAFTVTFTDTNVEEVGVDNTGGEFTITLDGDADTKPATYTVKVAVPTEIGKFAVTITTVI